MYFDALTLAAVADELHDTVLDGRIQRVVLPSPLSVALEIYAHGRRRHLLLSAHPQFTRVHLSAARPSRGVERETPLLLLLRKYVVGGRVVAITQPELERVLVLSIVKGPRARNIEEEIDEAAETGDWEAAEAEDATETLERDAPTVDFEPVRCELVVEAMERLGNIILVNDDNIILESARHVTPRMSRRPVRPREPYELPPRQEKRDPRRATPDGMRALLGSGTPSLARALVGAYRGISPLAAREVAFRATGAVDTALGPDLPWARLAVELRGLWDDDWQPCLVHEPAGQAEAAPTAYAPYLLTHLSGAAPAESISAVLDTFYSARERLSSHDQRRDAVRKQLLDARDRIEHQRRGLAGELERAADLDRLRWEGEMIYAFMHSLAPGQARLVVEDRAIELNSRLTPVENAQARFVAYDKAKGALAGVPERLQAAAARLAGLAETLALLELADGFEQIEAIARDAVEQGYIRPPAQRPRQKIARQAPLRVESSDGFPIYVGRSASQNEQVTFKIGAGEDVWLHARGLPGAHVIVKSGGAVVPESTLLEAAGLAAYFSQAREESAVEIDIAPRSQVRRMPGGPPGLATYHAERTIRAAPRPPEQTQRRPPDDERRQQTITDN
jgi:predicted ribosome quality control (RQC) complex YloA/Tae2 family protein